MQKTPQKIACYRLLIEDNDNSEVNFVSLVEDPAIEINWFAFSNGETKPKMEEIKFKITNSDKKILTGIFMVPDKPIYRIDPKTGEEFYVVFTSDDIERAVKKFSKNGYSKNIDVEHSGAEVAGCYVMDSWFIRDDQTQLFGFKDIPKGAWVGSICVEDDALWNDFIKTGKLKGFSVAGLFKLGKKTLIDAFSNKVEDKYSPEELKLIDDIADLLLGEE